MAVPAGHGTAERSDVEDQLMVVGAPAAPHDRVSAGREVARRRAGRRRRLQGVEGVESGRAQEPEHLGGRTTGRPRAIGATEEGGRGREDAAEVVLGARRERQERAAVGVSDLGHRAVGAAQRQHEVEHPGHALEDRRRDRPAVSSGEDQEMQIELERVALVARRQLEVDAVGQDVARALVHQDPRAELAPAIGARQVGKDQPRVDEAEGLAGQVRVRREVVREIALHVCGVVPDRADDPIEQG